MTLSPFRQCHFFCLPKAIFKTLLVFRKPFLVLFLILSGTMKAFSVVSAWFVTAIAYWLVQLQWHRLSFDSDLSLFSSARCTSNGYFFFKTSQSSGYPSWYTILNVRVLYIVVCVDLYCHVFIYLMFYSQIYRLQYEKPNN
jgi:hypothetical protein